MLNARLDLSLNAGCREWASALFSLPGTLHGSLMLGYLAFKCFHLTGQTCCWLSETWAGTGRAGRGVGQQLSPLHVPGCPRRDGWARHQLPSCSSLTEGPLPCLAQKIPALTVEK